jgi:hypothetical protein
VALLVSAILLGLFSVVLISAIRNNFTGGCTCFGSKGQGHILKTDIASNILLSGLSLAASTMVLFGNSGEFISQQRVQLESFLISSVPILPLLLIRMMAQQMESLVYLEGKSSAN